MAYACKKIEEVALDVDLSMIKMKKNRLAYKINVLAKKEDRDMVVEKILLETTTLGVKIIDIKRMSLKRKERVIDTEYGKLRVKDAYLNEKLIKSKIEFDDREKAAEKYNKSIFNL